ncbi:MAG: hypothetical protein LIO40_02900 [Ruminococcus sp.]|nr:hypothetical protein [Ruminococcus sp.]
MSEWTDKPWERQKGESAQAYEAFAMYRDMGTERSIRAVSQRLGKSKTLIDRWSREKSWVERVRAYDNELDKQAKAKAVREHKAMTERHISIAMQIQKKALEALKNLSVENMSPKDIKEFIKMATDLERMNRTIEETDKNSDESSERLADDIIAAYKKRKGDGDA